MRAGARHRVALAAALARLLTPGLRRLLMPSVGISPGPTAFRRTPYFAHSTASDLVITSMPALLMADGTT